MCLWKLKGLFEAKIHPTKRLLFIRKIRFHPRKYFYLPIFPLSFTRPLIGIRVKEVESEQSSGFSKGAKPPLDKLRRTKPTGFLCQAGSVRSSAFGIGPAGRYASRAVFPLR